MKKDATNIKRDGLKGMFGGRKGKRETLSSMAISILNKQQQKVTVQTQ